MRRELTQSTQPVWNQSCPFKVVSQRIEDKIFVLGSPSWSLPEALHSWRPLIFLPPARGLLCSPTAGFNAQGSYRNSSGSLASLAHWHLCLPSLVASLPQVLSSWHLSINFKITRPRHQCLDTARSTKPVSVHDTYTEWPTTAYKVSEDLTSSADL